ncbi:PREDICTED: uncharacterized protein LOC101368217 [Odobenus rosmarus divergens]|uniref:Uncharacterized protein LOC101368217 n=1 Tax=Odobenus rosmarus divergens TaxID=9708 RepID=A0A9B0GCS5_ODORO
MDDDHLCASRVSICASESRGNLFCGGETELERGPSQRRARTVPFAKLSAPWGAALVPRGETETESWAREGSARQHVAPQPLDFHALPARSSTRAPRHICCLFEQECAHPALATLGPQMAQIPVTGLKESYFPHCLPHLLTSSAAILIMGNLTLFYWKLLAVRLGFIVAFEHVVFSVRLLAWLVPDVPAALVTKIKRERYLAMQKPADSGEALL